MTISLVDDIIPSNNKTSHGNITCNTIDTEGHPLTEHHRPDHQLPSETSSYWRESYTLPSFPTLNKDIETDVVIVGGGITGITTAYLLVNEGINVVLIEADQLLNGTTGHTTAKVTAQHNLIYDELIHHFGKSKAKLYYEANNEALHFIRNLVHGHQIECEFSEQDAFLYSTTDEGANKIEKEAKAYESLDINGGLIGGVPFDLEVHNCLVMKNQAQFHPVKYLSHLIHEIMDKNGQIFENTTAVNIKNGSKPQVLTKGGQTITANRVLICSHFPFYEGAGLYSTRMYADRSYILAMKTKKDFPGGMYLSVDQPSRSLRSVDINGEDMVLVGGEHHKTGQGKDTMEHYKALESFGEQVFGIEKIAFRWSAQDLITLDNLPYIGQLTSGNDDVLIATGYRKWGMTNGTAAALLFRDIVCGNKNIYQSLFAPSRFSIDPSLKTFLVENANVASQLIRGKLEVPTTHLEDLANDEGAVIHYEGHRCGAYRDQQGELHIVDTTCTHIGCEVEWNHGDRSWDCPCHGSRFSYTGEVIEGPAEKALKKYDYHMIENATSEDSGY